MLGGHGRRLVLPHSCRVEPLGGSACGRKAWLRPCHGRLCGQAEFGFDLKRSEESWKEYKLEHRQFSRLCKHANCSTRV